MKRFRGFTLIELLVVVAIIALLIAILLPSLARAREQANRTVCATNLKGQGSALSIYAAKFSDLLPFYSYSGAGPVGLGEEFPSFSDNLGTGLTGSSAAGNNSNALFCPSNAKQSAPPAVVGGVALLGYAYLNDRWWANATPSVYPANTGVSGSPVERGILRQGFQPLTYQKKMTAAQFASDTELAMDEILSSTQTPTAGSLDTGTAVTVPSYGTAVPSSHLISTKAAAGGNVLYLDSHVSWRPFAVSTIGSNKTAFIKIAGSSAYYWVPSSQ